MVYVGSDADAPRERGLCEVLVGRVDDTGELPLSLSAKTYTQAQHRNSAPNTAPMMIPHVESHPPPAFIPADTAVPQPPTKRSVTFEDICWVGGGGVSRGGRSARVARLGAAELETQTRDHWLRSCALEGSSPRARPLTGNPTRCAQTA